ncbi:MAG TPA: M23 family peptidase [Xanthobacteraceae bacterium]|nr:M23 family peptidase [Xanthobacteraceae bacterium]
MKVGPITGLLLAVAASAQAGEILRPRLATAVVEWPAAFSAVSGIGGLQVKPREGDRDVFKRLNAASERYLPDVAASAVPVLAPLDIETLLHDQVKIATGTPGTSANGEEYFFGFHAPRFFLAGPAGYHAVFSIQTTDIRELSDISLPDPVEIHISGFRIYHELEDYPTPEMRPVPALEARYPGLRRTYAEGHLRYLFTRFGVPYVVSIECFDGRPRLLRLICTQADRIAVHFINALRLVGGTPQDLAPPEPPLAVRPLLLSPTFTYYGPGKIFPGSGFRNAPGRADYTVYAPMRFPLEEAPAYANSQIYRPRSGKGRDASTEYAYPWRDNFCERRGFAVGQCPGGIGHQGQDLRPAPCREPLGNDRCDPAHNLVAVRSGAIMRSPKQEAVYIVVNNANEHIRFRYLHMEPRKMDEENLLSWRNVREGELIGQVSTYSKKENGTTYHLHFDIQVPTKYGWVFVNPYMTLVVAYERLIGGRGTELFDAPRAAQASENGPTVGPRPAASPPPEKTPKLRRGERRDKDTPGASEAFTTNAPNTGE